MSDSRSLWDPDMVPAEFRKEAADIVQVLVRACEAVERRDVSGLLAMFHDDPSTFLYDYAPPRETNLEHLRDGFDVIVANLTGNMRCEVLECRPYALGADAAWTASVMHVVAPLRTDTIEITYRATDIWRKIDGRWQAVHEHASVPVDPSNGQADLRSQA